VAISFFGNLRHTSWVSLLGILVALNGCGQTRRSSPTTAASLTGAPAFTLVPDSKAENSLQVLAIAPVNSDSFPDIVGFSGGTSAYLDV
jgi:hypothetical protein